MQALPRALHLLGRATKVKPRLFDTPRHITTKYTLKVKFVRNTEITCSCLKIIHRLNVLVAEVFHSMLPVITNTFMLFIIKQEYLLALPQSDFCLRQQENSTGHNSGLIQGFYEFNKQNTQTEIRKFGYLTDWSSPTPNP